jgi:hypothetical protein
MSNVQAEMPLFTKTYDFLAWLTPMTNHFPGVHRQTITRRLLDAALDFQENILEANSLRGANRSARLQMADGHLSKIRLYLRLAHHWRWMTAGQYAHASRLVAELGRLLGGWQRVTQV